ncbi:MAG: hypothetical protein ACREBF_03625 [Candidatus Micrarchaeales archaeon]
MDEKSKRDNYKETLLLLLLGSALLISTGVYFVQIFSLQYGIGAGAVVQSNADNTNVAQNLQGLASQLDALNRLVMESYLAVILGVLALLLAFLLYLNRHNRYDEVNRRYIMLHTTVSAIYIVLFAIIYSSFIHSTLSFMVYLGFFGMIVCIISDAYFEYSARLSHSRKVANKNITIDPQTPYSNIQNLRGKLFSNLKGNIRIVDKHFNSDAIANLHRLFSGDLGGIDSISVMTSGDMIDSYFGNDYRDLVKEFRNNNVEFEVKVMSGDDAGSQHERFLFDDVNAFKIPPLNIIHKKSEHITKINLNEARDRYTELSQRATKIDNFLMRQGRGE